MAKGFFITATDTGVGKTVVAGALIRAIRREGLSVCGMKPVESGCAREGDSPISSDGLVPSDGLFLKKISEVDESIEDITPYRFEEPLAPLVAAERAGTGIDTGYLIEKFGELSEKYDALVVEGIGGIMVPIKEDYLVAHLAADFGLPLVVVASPVLGTINHTLLTVDYALRVGLKVAGIILNNHRPPEGTLAEKTNPDVIKRLAPVPVMGVMPYLEGLDSASLEGAASGNLDMGLIRKHL
jgi:dethiobiotin synthetase